MSDEQRTGLEQAMEASAPGFNRMIAEYGTKPGCQVMADAPRPVSGDAGLTITVPACVVDHVARAVGSEVHQLAVLFEARDERPDSVEHYRHVKERRDALREVLRQLEGIQQVGDDVPDAGRP